MVFAEGEEEKSIRAALAFRGGGYGVPVLIGRENRITKTLAELGLPTDHGLEIHGTRRGEEPEAYIDFLYGRLQRKGALARDCQRMISQERNVFAACMVALGDADAMVTGLTRNYHVALDEITRVLDPRPGEHVFGLTMMVAHGRTVFLADTAMHAVPSSERLAHIAEQSARRARQLGHEPRVALLSFSNFGRPLPERAQMVRDAVAVLDGLRTDFEYDGEMSAAVALDHELMGRIYPFCRLSGPANVLVMPGLNSASISSELMQILGTATAVGPMLTGLSKPAQIVPMGATVSDMVNMAALAAHAAVD